MSITSTRINIFVMVIIGLEMSEKVEVSGHGACPKDGPGSISQSILNRKHIKS